MTEWQVPLDYGETWIDKELEKNNLQYIVNREPLLFDGEPKTLKTAKGEEYAEYNWTYRVWPDGTREPIAPVGADYQPMQNRTVFDFLNLLAGERNEIAIDNMQDYRSGKGIVLYGRLLDTERYQIPTDIAGEPIKPGIVFLNGHDGHTVIGGMFMPERIFCSNQLAFIFSGGAIRNGDGADMYHSYKHGPSPHFKIKHTSGAGGRLGTALKALEDAAPYYWRIKTIGEELAGKRIKTRDMERFLKKLIPIPQKPGRGQTLALKRADEIRTVWRESDNLNDIRFTRWGFLNALVEWNDHNRNYGDENVRFDAVFRGRNLYREALTILEK